jgi:hypothetical protein
MPDNTPLPKIPRPPSLPRIEGLPPRKDDPPASRRSTAFVYKLAELQVHHPWRVLGVVAAITAVALVLATRLTVLTGFESLIPESRPSVQELRRVASHTAGVSTLFIVLQGNDQTPTDSLRKAADALVPELEKLGPPWVGSAESGVHEAIRFLGPRAGLFAEIDKLKKLRDDVEARYTYEVSKVTGADLELDDEVPPEITAESLKSTFGVKDAETERYPGGYFQSKDGKTVVVAVRSKVLGSDFAKGNEALSRIRGVIDRVNVTSFHPGIHYGFGGDLQTGISEYVSINNDLTEVGYTGAILITAVVFLYYLRIRTIVTMLITIGIGVAWTFGFTQLAIGHLNLATGFLFTIVAGNGINFGIIFMARYLEVRRRGAELSEAIRIAHRETWLPTATAGFAAAAAYGSLVITEFRGFRDFGLIGGVGMVLCWIATYLALPSILTVIERLSPLRESDGLLARARRATEGGAAFGKPFAALSKRWPRALSASGVALAVGGLIAAAFWVIGDPMEYDLRNLRNDASARAREMELSNLGDDITGLVGSDGMAILVDRPEQVAPLRAELYRRRDAAPPDAKPFAGVHALQDFVPEQQAEKIPILLDIKDKVMRAKKRGVIKEADWQKIEEYIPPDDLKPFGVYDMPAGLARSFTETDGTRGRIVYISPIDDEAVHDAHYLFRWADSYREVRLPDGSLVRGSGRAVIYADMWTAIVQDVPRAVIFSLLATILVVVIAFRAGRPALAVLAALFVGIGWMAVPLVALNVRLNFLNFIALPITFGIGVDYAVNVVQRYVREGAGGALTAVKETGGAVILCSLTTTLGYLALIRSLNYSVRSLGIAAVIGELACMFAAVLVLPAGLIWLDKGRPHGGDSLVSFRPPRR